MPSIPSNLPILFVVAIPFFIQSHCSLADSIPSEWPQWRGPSGQGHAMATNLPTKWDDTSNVQWKIKTPGRGWSSPVIVGNQIWLTTAVEVPASPEDAKRRLQTNTGDQPLTLLEVVELKALCIDRNQGTLIHELSLITVREPQWVHKLNSYASPTPVYDSGMLYCHFGAFGTACVNTASANVVWVNTELQVAHENGPGGSPIVVDDVVVFHLDGSDQQYVAALDKHTGQLAWKTDRSGEMRTNPQQKKSYGTPLIVEVDGKPQIISPASDWLYSYAPETGNELWKVAYGQLGFSVTPRPVVGHGLIFLATGFGKGQILAVKYKESQPPEIAWRFNKGTPTVPSPLLVGNELYFVSDTGVFTCLDALTGNEIYRERLGGNFSSSPWDSEGRIYASNREGVTFVIKSGRSFELLAENAISEAIYATPATVDRTIYLRTESQLYKIRENKR